MRNVKNRKNYVSQRGKVIFIVWMVLVLSILSCQAPVSTPDQAVATLEPPVSTPEIGGVTQTTPTSEPAEMPTHTPVIPADTATSLPEDEPTLAPTDTPEPPGVPVESFSNSSWMTVPPDDILEQLAYGGVGGGGGDGEDLDICEEMLPSPAVLYEYSEEIELFWHSWITVCGLTPDEPVAVTQHQPDGDTTIYDFEADPSGGLVYKFKPTFGDPIGEYIIEFTSSSGGLNAAVQVIEPDGPRLIELEDDALLLFYNFYPHETVRLLVYAHQEQMRKLHAWQELQVDPNGQLLVEMDLPPAPSEVTFFNYYTYYAIGEQSHTSEKEYIYFPCPGAMRSRLSVFMPSRVTFTDGRPLRVRTEPGFSGDILMQIPEGYQLFIIDGPRCVDEVYWWQVNVEGEVAWVAEGQDGMYFVEPWFDY